MNLSTHREWARFHFHTNPKTFTDVETLAHAAAEGCFSEDRKMPPHWRGTAREARREHLEMCAEEFLLVGEVIAVPQAGRLPMLINPGQVGVVAKADGSHLLHWTDGNGQAQMLPSNAVYLRRPATPFDMRGVPFVEPDGTVERKNPDIGFVINMFVMQADPLIEQIMTADLDPDENVVELPKDEDTDEDEVPSE